MSTFVTEINKLRNIQQNLDKWENTFVRQHSQTEQGDGILELHKNYRIARATQIDQLRKDVKDGVVEPISNINKLIKGEDIGQIEVMSNNNNVDLKLIKNEITAIQMNIQNVKNNTSMPLEMLQQEEKKLLEEIEIFENKVNEWDKRNHCVYPKKYVPKKVTTNKPENISQEVKDFMSFVTASGGHENRWDLEDHKLFLNARNKTKNVNKMALMVHSILPDISEEAVVAHEIWFKKYLDLKEKQKDSIKNWRETKIKSSSTPNKICKSKSPPECPEQNVDKPFVDLMNKEEKDQKLVKWKAEKRKEMMTKQEQKMQEVLKQKETEKQQKEKHKAMKAEVSNWRIKRNLVEEAEKRNEEKRKLLEREHKASRANKLIQQFQTQDDLFIKRKMELRCVRPKSTEIVVAKINQEVPRDPDRLFRPTKQWLLRSNHGDGKNNENENRLNLQTIPKL